VNCEDDLWRHYNIAGELNEFLTEDNSTCLFPPEPGVSLHATLPDCTPRSHTHDEAMQWWRSRPRARGTGGVIAARAAASRSNVHHPSVVSCFIANARVSHVVRHRACTASLMLARCVCGWGGGVGFGRVERRPSWRHRGGGAIGTESQGRHAKWPTTCPRYPMHVTRFEIGIERDVIGCCWCGGGGGLEPLPSPLLPGGRMGMVHIACDLCVCCGLLLFIAILMSSVSPSTMYT
jgi:hypothetical protein